MNRHASMNRIYRLVWSQVRSVWIPVAETAKGRGKSGRARSTSGGSRNLLSAAISVALGSVTHASPPVPTCSAPTCGTGFVSAANHPLGAQVVSGTASITQSGNTTDVRQSSPDVSIDWLSFNVGSQATVDFIQPSASAVAVNRISGANGSEILGHLDANGQVYLINPNGIVFGPGAQVNVSGLVASTLDANSSSTSGTQSFAGNGTGGVVNQGTITTTNGGYVVLVGNRVSNQGVITAKLGTVALGAGSAVTLDFSGDRLVHLQVDQSTLDNLAANSQLIQADGGLVIMTAGAQRALLASVVNNTGVIEARTVENHDGTIELLGGMTAGTVEVGGTLDASAPEGGNGGFIETNAAHVEVADGTKVTTAAPKGLTGTWLVDPTDFTVAPSGGDITGATLGSDLNSTNFTILSSSGASPVTGGGSGGNININDTVSWSANTTLTLTAANNVNVNANMTATGNTAGLVINPNTANGSEAASGSGVLNIGVDVTVELSGSGAGFMIANRGYILGIGSTIDLPNVSPISTTAFVVDGVAIHVINSLGTPGTTAATSLQGIINDLTGNFALGSNIDASATLGWNAGTGFAPIGTSTAPFTGAFDGLGHTIAGLVINRPTMSDVGLFGNASVESLIHNVGLVGGSVAGSSYVGGLVGSTAGTVENSYSTGSVTGGGDYIGGLVGNLGFKGAISDSYATGAVSGGSEVGGLVGNSFKVLSACYSRCDRGGTIDSSWASGTVSGVSNVGGLIGLSGGSLSNSYATGNVTGSSNFIGGLVGGDDGSISGSFATGNVGGQSDVGGLAGFLYGQISNSHATGSVTGSSYVGGLVGSSYGSGISNSFATGRVTGTGASVGGLVGSVYCGFYESCGGVIQTYATGVVTGNSNVGGLIGTNAGAISESYATANVSGQSNVGGLVGLNYGLNFLGFGAKNAPIGITSSYATGTASGSSNVGGLIGLNESKFTTSYSTGAVSGATEVGGLIGYNFGYGSVANSYATGSVTGTGSVAGGLIGLNASAASITNSFSAGIVSGSASTQGGLVGSNAGTVTGSFWDVTTSGQIASAAGIGMTTAQMQNQTNFTSATSANGNVNPGWDFLGTWVIYSGHTYPLLTSFLTPLVVTANSGSVTYDGASQAGALGVSYSVTPNANLLGTVSYASTPGDAVNVGNYVVTPGGLYSNQQGYNISYASGNLSIDQLASVTWTGGKTGNWSNAANWAGGAIPDYANVAAVTIPKGTTVTYDSGVIGPTVLTSLNDSGILVMAAGNLSTTGSLSAAGYQQTGGVLSVGGTLSVISSAGSVVLGDIDAAAVSITSKAGPITQLADTVIDVSGTTALAADSGRVPYAITLAQAGDSFGGTVTAGGSAITLEDAAALTAVLDSTGASTLTSVGAMTVSGAVGTTLKTTTTGTDAATTFGATTVGTNLTVTSTGAVTETSANILEVDGEGTTTVRNVHVTVNGVRGAKISAP